MSYAHFFFFVSLWARRVFLNKTKRRYWLTRKTIILARTVFSFLTTSILNLNSSNLFFTFLLLNRIFISKIIEYRCATQMCDKGVSLFFKLIRYEKYCCKLWSLKLLLKRIVRSLGVIFYFVMYIVKSKEFEVLHRSGSFFKNCKILDQ